jgi:hypothetical protein
MRKILDKITPFFIRAYNSSLLKNAPLGWQLQLPTITWVWLLITLVTIPIPFLIHLDNRGDDDILAVVLISVLTAVLEGFLFTYILIQFNNTKIFGRRVSLNGFKEQLAYLYVFMLCMMHIIFYPVIVDIRKGKLMTAEEIRNEAVIFNQASFYFMGDDKAYRYFPSDSTFLHYKSLENYYSRDYYNYNENDSEYDNTSSGNSKEEYYIEKIKPLMRAYFSGDSEIIIEKYTRAVETCPKLYMTSSNSITEVYFKDENLNWTFQKEERLYYDRYQLMKKSDSERLSDIAAFINLYTKYDDGYSTIHFDSPEETLKKYKSNRFQKVVYDMDDISAVPATTVSGEIVYNANDQQLNSYQVREVHSTIAHASHDKWKMCNLRLLICFFVALSLSLFLFLFKNVLLKEFILLFVYTALLTLAVTILNVIFRGNEDFPIHVVLAVFFVGIYFSFFDSKKKYYSSIKTIFILVSNLAFAFAPIVLFLYFYEYHDIGKIPDRYEYCVKHQDICDQHDQLVGVIKDLCLWGGIIFYMIIGSIMYKKVYERLWALPFTK